MDKVSDRAVVLGGSLAGLFAATVLAAAYREVLVIDRDELVGVQGPRRGVPHGRHVHGLLTRGTWALEDMYPDIMTEMVENGCPLTDLSGTVRWYFGGRQLQQIRAGMVSMAVTRPWLEWHVRRRVENTANVTFIERCDVVGLAATPDGSRIIGARIQRRGDGGTEEVLPADLVVDATGRGSRTPLWLEALGYARVEEEVTKIGLGYASRLYRSLSSDPFSTDHSIVAVASPGQPRGTVFTRTDHGRFELTLYGLLGDHPPLDNDGFNAFAKTLAMVPELYDSIVDADPVDDPVLFRVPTVSWRRYDRMTSLPDGFLVLGDAVCNPNPVFAQGMTLAATEALALRDRLGHGIAPEPLEFQRHIATIIKPAWEITNGLNLAFPEVEGNRTMMVKLGMSYMQKLHLAATRDASLTEAFMRAACLIDPPEALMKPGLILRVLRGSAAIAAQGRG
jgi:2-polyprenyl-6-methoxyphenol hydroxylase-like FAD-dependent oxidoreductase